MYDTASNHPIEEDLLEYVKGLKVYYPEKHMNAGEMWNVIKRSRVFIDWFSRVDRGLLSDHGCLGVIIARSSGYDHIDVEAAEEYNVCVVNQPEIITEAVAEYVVGGILSALRMIVEGHNYTPKWYNMGWPKHLVGYLLLNRSLGLLGAGRIGQRIAYMLKHLGVREIRYYTRSRKWRLEVNLGAKRSSPTELFRDSDKLVNYLFSDLPIILRKAIFLPRSFFSI